MGPGRVPVLAQPRCTAPAMVCQMASSWRRTSAGLRQCCSLAAMSWAMLRPVARHCASSSAPVRNGYGSPWPWPAVSVPTLDGRVGVKVPAGTADGRTLRVRGRGVPKRGGGAGDLLVTVKAAVPPKLDDAATEALELYAKAERESGFDPRAGWAGNR